MPVLQLQKPFETTDAQIRVENSLRPGRHRFRLIVVDSEGTESDPADALVTITGP
jgi:hypothetical protein